jgi:hypothetical protein
VRRAFVPSNWISSIETAGTVSQTSIKIRAEAPPSTAFSASGHDIFVNGWREKVTGAVKAVMSEVWNSEW